jgi:hypothetical protein
MEHAVIPRNKLEKTYKRFFEILPGALTWSALLFPVFASRFLPEVVAILVITFDLYWFVRSLYFTVNILKAYFFISRDQKKNWKKLLAELPEEKNHRKIPQEMLLHAVVLVFYKEPLEILRSSIASYAQSNLNTKKQLIIILGGEERAGDHPYEVFKTLEKEFAGRFFKFILSIHPKNLPGEIKCKSANATYAAKTLQKLLDELKIDYRRVLIHNFDADTRVHPEYFNCVAYKYLTSNPSLAVSFQPVHVYSNNIWDTPAIMRLVATSSTFTFMFNSLRPHRFRNFSSRSDVFQTLVDIGFYAVDAIPEDSRQYIDMFFYYKARIKIEPIFIPLRMDAVLAETYLKTLINQYRQLRRWAWGASDIAEFALRALQDKEISFRLKFWELFRLIEGHFSWAVAAIYITIIGWLPFLLSPNFNQTVIGYNLPKITKIMLSLASIGLGVVIVLSLLLYQPKPKHKPAYFYLLLITQWLLTPIVSVFFSSMAAIDAQTRLLLAKYLEYQVTEKKAVSERNA